MRTETVDALRAINRRFYVEHAAEFIAARQSAWPGWDRLLSVVADPLGNGNRSRTIRILDLGCGHGRFQRFLAERSSRPFHYTGIDSSASLLAEAVRDHRSRWFEADVLDSAGLELVGQESFDFIAVLAVMHHVPSFECRFRLLSNLVGRLAPRGVIVLSHWQFLDDPRLLGRIVPWDTYNRQSPESIGVEDLEDGDHMLAWGHDGGRQGYRYCHAVTPDEADRLAGAAGLRLESDFRADGRHGDSNLYQILRRSAESESRRRGHR